MFDTYINSDFLQEKMILKLYQPESFSPLFKYNICIMQDGDDYYQIGRIANLSDKLHADHSITNTIFVGIHYKDIHDRRKKYHPNGEQQQAYMKFLAHEVVPLLDDILPTYHMGQTRALIGDSLAGTLALMTSLTYPHTFGKVIMQSPYIDEQVLNTFRNTFDTEMIDIYHTIGTKETSVQTTDGNIKDFVTPNRELHTLISAMKTNYIYNELASGEHTWHYWKADLERALISIFC